MSKLASTGDVSTPSNVASAVPLRVVRHSGRHGEFTRRIPAAPLMIRFSKNRVLSGLKFLALAALAVGIGTFIAMQFVDAPSLRTQVVVSSAVCVLGGLGLLHLGLQSLFGRFCVDSDGIRLSPAYMGYCIPWNELRNWDTDAVSFRFTAAGKTKTFLVEKEFLTADDIAALHELLNECVPEKRVHRS